MRNLPDPDLSLRDATDFILNSPLGRKALSAPDPINLAVFVHDIVTTVFRLTNSCHLPEFTDHGINHLCSLVDRISRWTIDDQQSAPTNVVEQTHFSAREASILLLATLFHDIGMLSQRIEDLPLESGGLSTRRVTNLHTWVRDTHILRMRRLISFLFNDQYSNALGSQTVQFALLVAEAHGHWPDTWTAINLTGREAGLAAMLSVVDLLDEDSMRCDSATLLIHRQGTPLNRAHWIRHGLTANRVMVEKGVVNVEFSEPPRISSGMDVVFAALENHYRLVKLYTSPLEVLGAAVREVNFQPSTGTSRTVNHQLKDWWTLMEYETEEALIYHLISSFMAYALLDETRVSPQLISELKDIGLVSIDLTIFNRIRGTMIPRTAAEENFHALIGF